MCRYWMNITILHWLLKEFIKGILQMLLLLLISWLHFLASCLSEVLPNPNNLLVEIYNKVVQQIFTKVYFQKKSFSFGTRYYHRGMLKVSTNFVTFPKVMALNAKFSQNFCCKSPSNLGVLKMPSLKDGSNADMKAFSSLRMWAAAIDVVYFDQRSGAACTRKLVEILF